MKKSFTYAGSLALAVLALLWLTGGCSSTASFSYSTLEEAMAAAGPDASGEIIDSDNDGVPDAFVPVGGTPIPFEPITPPTPPDPDEPPILRDPNTGNCVAVVGTGISTQSSLSITAADLAGKSNLTVTVSGGSNTVTIDMAGASSLARIYVIHTGGDNTVIVRNAVMSEGFCNQSLKGNDNVERLESTSARLVDLQSTGGTSSKLDVLFKPDAMKYNISGNSHCVSYPSGTNILEGIGDGVNGTVVHSDGSTCL